MYMLPGCASELLCKRRRSAHVAVSAYHLAVDLSWHMSAPHTTGRQSSWSWSLVVDLAAAGGAAAAAAAAGAPVDHQIAHVAPALAQAPPETGGLVGWVSSHSRGLPMVSKGYGRVCDWAFCKQAVLVWAADCPPCVGADCQGSVYATVNAAAWHEMGCSVHASFDGLGPNPFETETQAVLHWSQARQRCSWHRCCLLYLLVILDPTSLEALSCVESACGGNPCYTHTLGHTAHRGVTAGGTPSLKQRLQAQWDLVNAPHQ
jgi:hypothetical protein